MMKNALTISLSLALTTAAVFGLSACGTNQESVTGEGNDSMTTQEAESNATIIDVRTPEEFAAGHVDGAMNLDFNNAEEFTDGIAKLDKTGDYVLYCRSGNRAGKAQSQMEKAGFNSVKNLGSLEQAASTLAKDIVK